MATETETFIKNLQKSQLSAECPQCNEEFSLSEALLFDGRKKFPLMNCFYLSLQLIQTCHFLTVQKEN